MVRRIPEVGVTTPKHVNGHGFPGASYSIFTRETEAADGRMDTVDGLRAVFGTGTPAADVALMYEPEMAPDDSEDADGTNGAGG